MNPAGEMVLSLDRVNGWGEKEDYTSLSELEWIYWTSARGWNVVILMWAADLEFEVKN